MTCNHIYSRQMFQEYPRLCLHCGEPEPHKEPMHKTNTTNPVDFPDMQKTETTTRFDLEQQILECWKITDDIPLLESQGANASDFTSLATVYEFKFKQLWTTFEALVKARKL